MAIPKRPGKYKCCVKNCMMHEAPGRRIERGLEKVSFFRFPSDRTRCLQWIDILKVNYLTREPEALHTSSYRVCALHFSSRRLPNGTKGRMRQRSLPIADHSADQAVPAPAMASMTFIESLQASMESTNPKENPDIAMVTSGSTNASTSRFLIAPRLASQLIVQQPQLVTPQVIQSQLGPLQLVPLQLVPPQLVPPQLVPPQLVPPQLVPPQLVPPQLVPPQLVPPQLVPPQLVPPQVVQRKWGSRKHKFKCCVEGCPINMPFKERLEHKYSNTISFYKFPLHIERCRIWLQRLDLENLPEKINKTVATMYCSGYRVCELHFTKNEIAKRTKRAASKIKTGRLVRKAVPAKDIVRPIPMFQAVKPPFSDPYEDSSDLESSSDSNSDDDSDDDSIATSDEASDNDFDFNATLDATLRDTFNATSVGSGAATSYHASNATSASLRDTFNATSIGSGATSYGNLNATSAKRGATLRSTLCNTVNATPTRSGAIQIVLLKATVSKTGSIILPGLQDGSFCVVGGNYPLSVIQSGNLEVAIPCRIDTTNLSTAAGATMCIPGYQEGVTPILPTCTLGNSSLVQTMHESNSHQLPINNCNKSSMPSQKSNTPKSKGQHSEQSSLTNPKSISVKLGDGSSKKVRVIGRTVGPGGRSALIATADHMPTASNRQRSNPSTDSTQHPASNSPSITPGGTPYTYIPPSMVIPIKLSSTSPASSTRSSVPPVVYTPRPSYRMDHAYDKGPTPIVPDKPNPLLAKFTAAQKENRLLRRKVARMNNSKVTTDIRWKERLQMKETIWKAEITELKSQVQKVARDLGKEKEKKLILRVKVMENAAGILKQKGIIS